jgi:Cu+-exporting ATPase
MQQDVVCGMQVDESATTNSSDYNGRTFYFCSSACMKKFGERPEAYANRAQRVRQHETALYIPRPPDLKPR